MQVFSNPTLITQSGQELLASSSAHINLHLPTCGRSKELYLGLHKRILDSPYLYILLIRQFSMKTSLALRHSVEPICEKNKEQEDTISANPKWYFLPRPTNPHPPTIKASSNSKS